MRFRTKITWLFPRSDSIPSPNPCSEDFVWESTKNLLTPLTNHPPSPPPKTSHFDLTRSCRCQLAPQNPPGSMRRIRRRQQIRAFRKSVGAMPLAPLIVMAMVSSQPTTWMDKAGPKAPRGICLLWKSKPPGFYEKKTGQNKQKWLENTRWVVCLRCELVKGVFKQNITLSVDRELFFLTHLWESPWTKQWNDM